MMPMLNDEGLPESASWVPFGQGSEPVSANPSGGSILLLNFGRAAETNIDERGVLALTLNQVPNPVANHRTKSRSFGKINHIFLQHRPDPDCWIVCRVGASLNEPTGYRSWQLVELAKCSFDRIRGRVHARQIGGIAARFKYFIRRQLKPSDTNMASTRMRWNSELPPCLRTSRSA